jgi:hypothetical protein
MERLVALGLDKWSDAVAWPALYREIALALNYPYEGQFSDELEQQDVPSFNWPGCVQPSNPEDGDCFETGEAATPAVFPYSYTGSTYDIGGHKRMAPPTNLFADTVGTVVSEILSPIDFELPINSLLQSREPPPLHLASFITTQPLFLDEFFTLSENVGGTIEVAGTKRWWTAPYCRSVFKIAPAGGENVLVQALACTGDQEGQGNDVLAGCGWEDWLPEGLFRLKPQDELPTNTDADLMADVNLAFDNLGDTSYVADYTCPVSGECVCGTATKDFAPADRVTA